MNLFDHIRSRVDCRRGSRGDLSYIDCTFDRTFDPPIPLESTQQRPGSAAKLNTILARVSNGESLWHPDDRVCFDHGGSS